MSLHFAPNFANPPVDSLNWIQLVRTNWQGSLPARLKPVSFDGGASYWFVDCIGCAQGDPWYNHGGVANHTDFIDQPYCTYTSDTYWFFYTFVGYEPDATHAVITSGGISWGYYDPLVHGKEQDPHVHGRGLGHVHLQPGDD